MASPPVFYKILNTEMRHRGYQYVPGLNTDDRPFDTSKPCSAGGLYFSPREHIMRFLEYGSLIAQVTIPEGVDIYTEDPAKFKAHQIILSNIKPIEESELCLDPEFCLAAVQQYCSALQYVRHQTEEICLACVKRFGLSLAFVKKQTPAICLAAVRANGDALQYVETQTFEICMAAVQNLGRALEYVATGKSKKHSATYKSDGDIPHEMHDICLEAVKKYGLALEYVSDQTHDICLEAVKQDGLALSYVIEQTDDICLEAVKQDGLALQYIKKKQTFEICMAAVQQNGFAYQFVRITHREIADAAVKKTGIAIEFLHIKSGICIKPDIRSKPQPYHYSEPIEPKYNL